LIINQVVLIDFNRLIV